MDEHWRRKPYYDFRTLLENRYGSTLHRVPIDFGLGCPNRDPEGGGGCTFCSEEGSRAKQCPATETVEKQVENGIVFARSRYGADRFAAYIQAFTGTFASAGWQRQQYEKLLKKFPFDAVFIGTRPDCLDAETLDFLEDLHSRVDVWVELGVQSVHNETLRRINRGHSWEQSKEAIARLKSRNLNAAVHVILGLPGEGAEAFWSTARTLNAQGIDAVKIHNLHVLKGTRLAEEYEQEPFAVFDEHQYAETLVGFLRRLSPQIPVMRLLTDSEPEEVIAPRWHMHKGQFLDYLHQLMLLRNVRQGDLVDADAVPPEPTSGDVTVKSAPDGSFTFWNADYKEHYHCPLGGRSEAYEKYVVPSGVGPVLQKRDVHVLDVCFGMGYNSLVLCNLADASDAYNLHITALEIDRVTVAKTAALMEGLPEDIFSWGETLRELYEKGRTSGKNFTIDIHWGDARHTIRQMPGEAVFDAVFLDPFSSQRSSTLWTVDFFRQLKMKLSPNGRLLTYSTAVPVRSGLIEAGFYVGNTPAFGKEKGGTTAALTAEQIEYPLNAEDAELIQTRKGIPYRDPSGTKAHKDILREREELVRKEKD